MNKTLPLELELDKAFAEEFNSADHSRVNLAFHRWQKRVYAAQNRDIYPVLALVEASLAAPVEVDAPLDILEGGPKPDFLTGVTNAPLLKAM